MSLEPAEGSDVRKIEQFIKIGQIVTAPLIAFDLSRSVPVVNLE